VEHGFGTIQSLALVSADELMNTAGLSEEQALGVCNATEEFLRYRKPA
jgi:hypothetical protein